MSPKSKASKPIDIYVRVSASPGREGDSFQSPDQQEGRCRSQLKTDGLEVGKVFIDIDQSGGKLSRPAFDQILERARTGVSGGIAVHDLTRFGRYDTMALQIIDLEQAGATFISCADKIDTSKPSGRAFLKIMEAMAVMQREEIGERTLVSKRNAVARGIHVTRHTPPGYVKGADGVLEPHPRFGPVITRAYELAAAGTPPADIARYLTEQGLPSAGEVRPWKSSRVGRLLANRVYLGEARASNEIVKKDAHTPLTAPITWKRAQRRKTGSQPTSGSTYLLSGLVRCAGCRHSMRPAKAGNRAPAMFRCGVNHTAGNCSCPSSVTMSALEDIVYEAYVERIFSKEQDNGSARPDDTAAKAVLEQAARAAVEEIEELHAKGELGAVAYGKALEAALSDLEDAEEALAALTPRFLDADLEQLAREALPAAQAEIERVKAGGRVLDGWDENAWALLRHGLAREITTVFVRPPVRRSKSIPIADRVKIIWKDEATPELPSRGSAYAPRPYTWGDAEEQAA